MSCCVSIRSLLLVAMAGVMGCATSGMSNVKTAAFANGMYDFRERGDPIESFTGRLRIVSDSVEVLQSTPYCVQGKRVATTETFVFTCGSYGITALYRTGQWTFRYTGTTTEAVHSETCTVYQKTPSGGQVCTKTTTSRADRVVPFSGTLHLTPVDAGGAAPRSP